jgi:hypothetical protein
MAFREGLLQHIDLSRLLAQQAATAQEERSRQLQNELMKQQIQKNKDIRDLALGQGGIPYTSALSNSASIGYPEFRLEQERQKAFSQLSGQPLPTQGIIGYGGGGVHGGGGPSEAETNLMNQQANLAEEQARQAQYKRQGYGSATSDLLAQQKIAADLAGEQAKADASIGAANIRSDAYKYGADKRAETATSAATGKKKQKEADVRIAGRQADQKELEGYYNKLYSTEYWKGEEGGEKSLTAEQKQELAQILPGVVKKAQLTGKPLDLTAFIESYINRNK